MWPMALVARGVGGFGAAAGVAGLLDGAWGMGFVLLLSIGLFFLLEIMEPPQ